MSKLKVCIIGLKGSISTVLISGILQSVRNKVKPGALLTDLPVFDRLGMVKLEDIEFGGFDIRDVDMYTSAIENDANNILRLDSDLDIKDKLNAIPVFKGITMNSGDAITALAGEDASLQEKSMINTVNQIRGTLRNFKGSDNCVVVNLASTEENVELSETHSTLEKFELAIENNSKEISPCLLYAYAALKEKIPYVNFTPSIGSEIPALCELAQVNKVPHAGKDGKTGETLVKTALADLFVIRNLDVNIWYGANILGNMDGKILDNSKNASTKIESKKSVLKKCLGYEADSKVRIEYMKSMDDNKVAWDHILFTGFCGAKMMMNFTWFGIDSFLAAPLVIDLVRLINLANNKGDCGIIDEFAVFFKSPMGTDLNSLVRQYQNIEEWAIKHYTNEAENA
jgi:myo-inositol-1-phosphate synthase